MMQSIQTPKHGAIKRALTLPPATKIRSNPPKMAMAVTVAPVGCGVRRDHGVFLPIWRLAVAKRLLDCVHYK
jgi:hypothetical protein